MDNSTKRSEESLFVAWLSKRESYVGIITVAVEFIVKMMVSTFCAGQMVWLLLAREHPLPTGLGQAFADRERVTAIAGAVTLFAAVAIVAACRMSPKSSGLGLFERVCLSLLIECIVIAKYIGYFTTSRQWLSQLDSIKPQSGTLPPEAISKISFKGGAYDDAFLGTLILATLIPFSAIVVIPYLVRINRARRVG